MVMNSSAPSLSGPKAKLWNGGGARGKEAMIMKTEVKIEIKGQ
jgi:hypothetical protein